MSDIAVMDYISVFSPVFSLVAHASCAIPGISTDRQLQSVPGVREKVDELLASARSHRRSMGRDAFDSAWFALCAWLDEALPGPKPYVRRYFAEVNPGREFFTQLDRLLDENGLDNLDAERLGVLEVYAACLELGFRGTYAQTEDRPSLDVYRKYCAKDLAKAAAVLAPYSPTIAPAFRARPIPGWLAQLPYWILPVAATLLLYSLYRFLLSGMFAAGFG